jgi:hypothetical protein
MAGAHAETDASRFHRATCSGGGPDPAERGFIPGGAHADYICGEHDAAAPPDDQRRAGRQPGAAVGDGLVPELLGHVDWLLEPPLQRLLDNMAASPSAFGGVRFFHALDSGTRASTIDDDPLDGGIVWPDLRAPMNFSRTFDALATPRARPDPVHRVEFLSQGSQCACRHPAGVAEQWKLLVRRFLDALAADPRFGPAIRNWWFEVWNEPNGQPFWRGRYDAGYFDLYRATSEAVLASEHPIRIGGPAIVYRRDAASRRDMEAFLRFLHAEPGVKCDFLSLHAKGIWSSSAEPELRNAVDAMTETADLALAIDPVRFKDMPIINDEADMRVGFNIPYQARLDERFAAWLCALMIAYDGLSALQQGGISISGRLRQREPAARANRFRRRRSLCTRASPSAAISLSCRCSIS